MNSFLTNFRLPVRFVFVDSRLQNAYPDALRRDKGVLAGWLATLDYLTKAMIAGKSLQDEHRKEAFLD